MWQQWVTVVGLVADLIGFGMIAFEWHRAFTHAVEIRNAELQEAYERNEARENKKKMPRYTRKDEEGTMAVEFSRLFNREAGKRYRLFVGGVTLFLLGFLLQVIGAWPIGPN